MALYAVLLICFSLFAITACLGLTQIGIRELRHHNAPASITMLHGLPATAGLTVLVYATYALGVPPLAIVALILFLIAAAGGAVLNLAYQQRGHILPRWLM